MSKTPAPGYSGKPLLQKLGFKSPLTLVAIGAPAEYASWLGEVPSGMRIVSRQPKDIEAAHVFVTKRESLKRELTALRKGLRQTGFVWVSWPKKSSKVPTDITEDVIRDVALPLGFVDIKVCAVSDVWSGLKLVIRRDQRSA
jgi:hypothetical protein